MTVLAPATGVSQLDGEAGAWEHCGEACIASLCDDAGLPRNVLDVVSWMKANGMDPDRGTPGHWIVQYLAAAGIPSHQVWGDSSIDATLDQRRNILWCVYCDGRGNLNGSHHATHWVRLWGHSSAGVEYMNPLGDPVFGQNHTDNVYGVSTGEGVAIDVVLPADLVAAPPPPPKPAFPKGENMKHFVFNGLDLWTYVGPDGMLAVLWIDKNDKQGGDNVGGGHAPSANTDVSFDVQGRPVIAALGAKGEPFRWRYQGGKWVGLTVV